MDSDRPSFPRIYCAWLIHGVAGLAVLHGLEALLPGSSGGRGLLACLALLQLGMVALSLGILGNRRLLPAVLATMAMALLAQVSGALGSGDALLLAGVGLVQLLSFPATCRQLPSSLEGLVQVRPWLTRAWALVAGFAVLQVLGWTIGVGFGLRREGGAQGWAAAVSLLLLLGTGLGMARWVDGRTGVRIAVLLPLLFLAPALGQLLADRSPALAGLCFALLALRAFERRAGARGGLHLAIASSLAS